MNELRVATRATNIPGVFDTYWMTGLLQKGRVRVIANLVEDGKIAAELYAIKFLLESKNVCGHDKSGAGLRIWVTYGAIPKLMKESSGKPHLIQYANFLRTRFVGAEVAVENKRTAWIDDLCAKNVEEIDASVPSCMTIQVNGIGEVELSAHAVARYIERFERPPVKAWRDLVKLCKDARPVAPKWRNPTVDLVHRSVGKYWLAETVVLVVAQGSEKSQLPTLVSVLTNENSFFA